jgi:hypothetical protein
LKLLPISRLPLETQQMGLLLLLPQVQRSGNRSPIPGQLKASSDNPSVFAPPGIPALPARIPQSAAKLATSIGTGTVLTDTALKLTYGKTALTSSAYCRPCFIPPAGRPQRNNHPPRAPAAKPLRPARRRLRQKFWIRGKVGDLGSSILNSRPFMPRSFQKSENDARTSDYH